MVVNVIVVAKKTKANLSNTGRGLVLRDSHLVGYKAHGFMY